VRLYLTEQGRALREKAKSVPSCIFAATGTTVDTLKNLQSELLALRGNLHDSL